MIRFIAALTLLSSLACKLPADPLSTQEDLWDPESRNNVILITWDGVRHQEFFGESPDPLLRDDATPTGPPLKLFWEKHARNGAVYGTPGSLNILTTANPSQISLPGYQNIFTGRTHRCFTNDCGRVEHETLLERIARVPGIHPAQVASISSWSKLALAAEHVAGRVFTNAGRDRFQDPAGNTRAVEEINRAVRSEGGPSSETRWDRFTWKLAMHYLERHRPRFLHIGLNDTDDLAHQGKYGEVIEALHQNDRRLDSLISRLEKMSGYGEYTTVILTTDHGRGRGPFWRGHGSNPDAAPVWLYARGPYTPEAGKLTSAARHSHLDIRPTIELLMGMCPQKEIFDLSGYMQVILAYLPDGWVDSCRTAS